MDAPRESYAVYLDLTGRFQALGTEHNILFGADYYLQDEEFFGVDGPVPGITTIDIFNPVYGTIDHAAFEARMETNPNFFFPRSDEWYGIYFQDQIDPSRLTVQLNINNLLDKEYFKTAFGRPSIQVGEPLTVLGSIRVEY